MTNRKLICVHSLTAHGLVGLRPFIEELGPVVVPVPSLLLTGPGNMPGCRRFSYDFEAMLDGVLSAQRASGQAAKLFVGYLADAAQVAVIERALERYADVIDGLVVDPISGDNGRSYVSAELITAWPRLLSRAELAFPNLTEAEILTGEKGEAALKKLRELFPRTGFVVTGWPQGEVIATRYCPAGGEKVSQVQPRIDAPGSGTGDLFASIWMRETWLRGRSAAEALRSAAETVAERLSAAIRH